MLTIACVLKSGNFKNGSKNIQYFPEHVTWLKRQVEKHVTVAHRFVCLSDMDIPECEVIPLINNWPGWWPKMELFRPGLFDGPVFFIDLDTVILSNIDKMVCLDRELYFVVLKNLAKGFGFGSGLMAWRGNFSPLYEVFEKDAGYYMQEYSRQIGRWGDQGFLQEHLQDVAYWQDLFPRAIISYFFDMHKRHITEPLAGGKIVCFQGKPKPWDLKAPWIPKL